MRLQSVAGKRVMALFFSLCIVLSSFSTAFAAAVDAGQTSKPVGHDIKGHWAETVLKQWMDKGLINGFKDGSLKPDNKITRAEFASFVNRANSFTEQASISFKDVSAKDWYYADVAKAKAAGYINGYSDQTFRPKQTITRLETAFIVAKLQKLGSSSSADKLTDTAGLSASSKTAIGAVIDAGFMSATNGKFRPQDSLSRAEAVTVIDRAASKKETFAVTYDKAGEYGSKSTPETIKGSVAITASGVTLNNIVIEGDLLLAESIGQGDVFLKNVTVKGKTTVNGGGKNSIHFEDSVLLTVIVDKKDGSIRIVAEGSTTVKQITLQSGARLEESQLTGSGFGDLVLAQAIPSGAEVDLSGRFETVDVIATSLRVNLSEGSIAALQVAASASNTNINIGAAANVASLILNAVTSVTGQGVITSATINASGSTIAQTPTNVTVGSGVNATVNGRTATTTNANTNAGGGSSTSSGSGSSTSSGSGSGSSGGGSSVTETVYGFSGKIVDADGVPVSGVQINFRSGIGNETGVVLATAVTDVNGKYSVTIRPGVYFGEVVKAGYLKTFVVGVSLSDGFNPGQNATIVKVPQAEEIRIVLTWGENPRDEDSHLLGPTPTGGSFHTAYYSKQYSVNGIVYADLDIDDVESYGPETTTIRHRVDGKYQFYVHHYSGISTLRKSGAKVEVYVGATTVPAKTYLIPTGEGTERYWDVFEMNINGADVTFTERNVLTNTEPTSDLPTESRQPHLDEIFIENNYGAADILYVSNLSVNDVVYYYSSNNTQLGFMTADPYDRFVMFSGLDFGANGTTIQVAVQSEGRPISSKLSVNVPSEAAYAASEASLFDSIVDIPVTASVNDVVYLQAHGILGTQTDFRITSLESISVPGATYLTLDASAKYMYLSAFNTSDSPVLYHVTVEVTVSGQNAQTKEISIVVPTVEIALQDAVTYADGMNVLPGNETIVADQVAAARAVLNNPASTKQDYIDNLTALIEVIKESQMVYLG